MFTLVFALLLGLAVLMGPIIGFGVSLLVQGRRGAWPPIIVSSAAPLLITLLLGGATFAPERFSVGQDWDVGGMDVFKTPLGGGFFVTSIDSAQEYGFLDGVQRDHGRETVTRLGCANGVSILTIRNNRRYALVDVSARQLTFFRSEAALKAALAVPPHQMLTWTNRTGFEHSTCAVWEPPQVVMRERRLWNLTLAVVLAGPVALGLWVWRVRARAIRRQP